MSAHRAVRAVVALLALLAGCASRAVAPAPVTPPSAAPSGAALAALVARLGREAAAIRGLELLREVPVRVESEGEIAAHQRRELADDRDELDEERRIGAAMGVLPPAIDLVDVLARFVGAEAQGYYDPSERVLVLTEAEAAALGSPTPEGLDARATVVHELTHALQHQHFAARVDETHGPSPALSDGARARLALLEGDATLAAMEWAARRRGGRVLGAPDMAARLARWAEGAMVLTEVDAPRYLIDSAEIPYEAGALAVGALYARGGWTAVNAALADESLRAAEVLHPERAAVAWAAVPDPAAEALAARGLRRTVVRTLGEIELRLYLGLVTREERAAALAGAWRGDRFALFEGPAGLAMVWQVACADEPSARAVAAGLAPLAERWRREGCPGIAGGAAGVCPARIAVDGSAVTIARGE